MTDKKIKKGECEKERKLHKLVNFTMNVIRSQVCVQEIGSLVKLAPNCHIKLPFCGFVSCNKMSFPIYTLVFIKEEHVMRMCAWVVEIKYE